MTGAAAPDPDGFVVLVPVKPPAVGKSRLVGLPDERRQALARAFALDTVEAALGARRVVAVLTVTDDARFSAALSGVGCHAIPDGVSLDLNATLRQAAAESARRWPNCLPVALCADLPALLTHELDVALAEVGTAWAEHGAASFVSDADGVGTTLYAAAYEAFDPHFGIGSAATHRARGALPVGALVPSLRRDVDDVDDLAAAAVLGLGPRTAAVLAGG